MSDVERVSHTVMSPARAEASGFNVSMPGLDLATLIQMASSQRQRLIVRVHSLGQEGLLYFTQGQLVHATANGFAGEPAVRRMLAWSVGDFQVCDRAWPSQTTITSSIEGLLLRAAQSRDEDNHHASQSPPARVLPLPNLETQRSQAPSREATGPRAVPMRRDPPQLPPPLPASAPPSERVESAVVASVRISEDGQVIPGHGDADTLSQLVAYTMRLGTLAGAHLGLEPMDALYADLGDRRVVVFNDQGDTVGLVLTPGTTVTELRRQLGV